MGNTIRFTGLSSGLDTESIVKAILTPYQSKVDTIKKNSTLAEWKKDAYKEMSSKIQNFRTKGLANLKYASTLNKSSAKISQEGVITVDTNGYKEDGTHKIQVNELATAAAVKVNTIKGKVDGKEIKLTKSNQLTDIEGIKSDSTLSINGKSFDLGGKTIEALELEINTALPEINFKFDESVGAFMINSKKTGKSQTIDLDGTDESVLKALGAQASGKDATTNKEIYKYEGKNAEILYNDGVSISSESNDIEVNGIKFTAVSTSTQPVTVTISKDVDTMMEAITSFVDEYNSLLTEINTKLSVDSAKGYEPLTDEEKEAMTEKEIEAWESKIKNSLLRNDSTLKDLTSMLRECVTNDYSKNGGTLDESCSLLSQIGISSSNWSDKGKLTINEEKLKAAIANDGDKVVTLFTTIANKMDKELDSRSSTTELRSYGQFFSDKTLTSKISQYAKDLITAQSKYDTMENIYYKKFTAMETAMNNLNSQSSLFSSL